MRSCHRKLANKNKFKNKNLFFFGVVSLLWFVFRTGTKPSRIVYPCQRAALANSSILVNAFVSLSLTAALTKTRKFFSKRGKALAILVIMACVVISSEQFWGSLRSAAVVDPNQEIQLVLEPRNATAFPASDIYVVNGRDYAHISELINLMASHGLSFYKTSANPDGLIARDDVVLIKINCQWAQRGGTNTDVLKELIQTIVDHPEGFVGEIVVADNGQVMGGMNFGNYNNAEDTSQSTQDVVNMFSPPYNVSTYEWRYIRTNRVYEYSEGDMTEGYVRNDTTDPETGFYVSYPKFKTQFGTYISFKHGIWNGTGYEKRLKVINLPVLKSHLDYGVTASLKNYMGVQSEGKFGDGGLSNGHFTVGNGSMGTLMVETGLPTLNILDAIWVNANPSPEGEELAGPETNYDEATRVNVLITSTDPVAVDYWAAKHVLVQAATLIGYNDTRMLDPDNTDKIGVNEEAFGVWLNLAKNEIAAGGYNVTTSESRMNVYVYPYSEFPEDTTPPAISLLSPENKTYPINDVPLTFTVNEAVSWIGYSLNGQANITITGNSTLFGLPDGLRYVVVYANDTVGNMGASSTVYFTVDTTPPNITSITQIPPSSNVLPEDEVKVNATVTDAISRVKQVILNYTNGNGTWIPVAMQNLQGNVWNATIPEFPYCTTVTYTITAEDNAGNTITTKEMGYEYQYHVISEFPHALILPLFIITTLVVIMKRRKPSSRGKMASNLF